MTALASLPLSRSAAKTNSGGEMRRTGSPTLVAYFSRSGNTRVVAGLIHRALNTDLFEILPASPYPEEYLATVEQATIDERPPPNGKNGTHPSCFWAAGSQQALRELGAAALDRGAGLLPNLPLSQVSQQCREVLRSAVECASSVRATCSSA